MSAGEQRDACPSGCGRTVAPGKLMCFLCWREVPRHLQTDVYRTWRAYRAANVHNPDVFRRARAAYQAARDAALGSIR